MKYAAAAGVLALAGAASANFQMVEQTMDFTNADTPVTLTFQKAGEFFGGALPLKGVKFTYTLEANGGSFAVDNDGPNGGVVSVQYGLNSSLASDDVTIPSLTVNPGVDFGGVMLGPDDEQGGDGIPVFDVQNPDLANDDFFSIAGVSMQMDMAMADILEVLFFQYEGMGTFDVDADINNDFDISGLGDAVAGQFTLLQGNGSLTLTYLYAPAPGAAALLGFAGLAATRRRRA